MRRRPLKIDNIERALNAHKYCIMNTKDIVPHELLEVMGVITMRIEQGYHLTTTEPNEHGYYELRIEKVT